MKAPFSILTKSWTLAPIFIAACWTTIFFGHLTVLIIPALVTGIVVAIRSRAWLALIALLLLNPLGVFFARGVVEYVQGAPTLRFVGLPRIESFNIDPSSRCFRSGGGCLVDGHEWVVVGPHNAALRLMSAICGAPARSYDGPYPSLEEVYELVVEADPTPVSEFLQGQIRADGQVLSLDSKVVAKLVKPVSWISLDYGAAKAFQPTVQGKLVQDRCLVVRLALQVSAGESKEVINEGVIFFDLRTMRPFAYFNVKDCDFLVFPPLHYLPELDR